MPHALLLSPDDQAVTAITGVLEEMSVTCERPLDGVSAAQKLNSQSFDLVLVDCENLPAAKLIFDVCRRGKNGRNPVPIAIVDGRAGLPTAFRLGAELILTKPVAKDQARGTIRTAVSRVRKHVQPNENVVAHPSSAHNDAAAIAPTAGSPVTEDLALAAAASASPSFTARMHSALDEIDSQAADPASNPPSASLPGGPLFGSSPTPAKFPLSDDPVLAELERTELEEAEGTEPNLAESQKPESHKKGLSAKLAADSRVAKSDGLTPSSHSQERQKARGPLLAFLMLALAGCGFYAAWTYQPGFRSIVQPQIDRVLVMVGISPTTSPSSAPAKPVAKPTPAPAPASTTDPNATHSNAPDSPTGSAVVTAPAPASKSGAASVSPANQPAMSTATTTLAKPLPSTRLAIAPASSGAAPATKPIESNTTIALSDSKNDSKRETVLAISSTPRLPGEDTVILLSSKGAEARLTHSVAPKYPAEALAGGAEGTVVLKAVVDESGKVEGVRLVEGNAILAPAAIQAVKEWRYRPYIRDGKAQPFQTLVSVDFPAGH
jgi:TonB family protein